MQNWYRSWATRTVVYKNSHARSNSPAHSLCRCQMHPTLPAPLSMLMQLVRPAHATTPPPSLASARPGAWPGARPRYLFTKRGHAWACMHACMGVHACIGMHGHAWACMHARACMHGHMGHDVWPMGMSYVLWHVPNQEKGTWQVESNPGHCREGLVV